MIAASGGLVVGVAMLIVAYAIVGDDTVPAGERPDHSCGFGPPSPRNSESTRRFRVGIANFIL